MTHQASDFKALRELLSSWNLTELIDYFEREDITIEVLKLLKTHQIPMILNHFKMGVRIRFEHHFEQWRRDINKPLQTSEAFSQNTSFYSPRSISSRPMTTLHNNTSSSKSMPTDVFHRAATPDKKQMASPIKEVEERPPPSPTPPTVSQEPNPPASPPSASLQTPSTSTDIFKDFAEKETEYYHTPTNIKVLDILKYFGGIGTEILEFYEKNKELSPAHRILLVQLTVDYFVKHDLHLSLKLSYVLENQILKLFPTESLKYYRNEKRGKIYSRYSNIKRYRRDKRTLPRTFFTRNKKRSINNESVPESSILIFDDDSNSSVIEDEGVTQDNENWPEPSDNAVHVKSEIDFN